MRDSRACQARARLQRFCWEKPAVHSFIVLLVVAFGLYWLVHQLSWGRRHFNQRDMTAFKKAQRLRKELKEVELLVGPKQPDQTFTLGVKNNKP